MMIGFRRLGIAGVILGCTWGVDPARAIQVEPLPGLTWQTTSTENFFGFVYKPDESKPVIEGYISIPKGIGPFRTVILNHSPKGSAGQAVYHYGPKFVDRGYASISANLDYGTKVEESDFVEMFRRLSACIDIIKNDDRLDENKIYMYGNGPGAMVSLAFAAQSDKILAVGLTGSGLLPKDGVNYEKISAPMILVHGANDQSVPLDKAMQLKANLERAKKTVEVKVIEKSGHEVITLKPGDVYDPIVAFFNKHTK